MAKPSFGDETKTKAKLFIKLLVTYEKERNTNNLKINWKKIKNPKEHEHYLEVKSARKTLINLYNNNYEKEININQFASLIKTLTLINIVVDTEKRKGVYLFRFESKNTEDILKNIDIQWSLNKSSTQEDKTTTKNLITRKEELAQAPYLFSFYGRRKEKKDLKTLLNKYTKIIAITGDGGCGKSYLAAKVVQEIKYKFHYVIWFSLQNAPSIDEVLLDTIKFLSNQNKTKLSSNIEIEIATIIDYFRKYRCLVILDNGDTDKLIRSGGEKKYQAFFEAISQEPHKSSVIVTRRDFIGYLGNLTLSNIISLDRLQLPDYRHIIESMGLSNLNDENLKDIIQLVDGNIVQLKTIIKYIQNNAQGHLNIFLNSSVFIDLKKHMATNKFFEWLFSNLSTYEKEFLYWLAINFEPVTLTTLRSDLLSNESKDRIEITFESLANKLPLILRAEQITLETVFLEAIREKFVEEVEKEIIQDKFFLFHTHALVKVESKNYLKESQLRLLVRPLLDRLNNIYGNERNIRNKLTKILSYIRDNHYIHGYVGGNIFNLLTYLKSNLDSYDFSRITLRQTDFKTSNLTNVNFSYADFKQPAFLEVFDHILSVAFSPQGSLLAAGDASGQIHLWTISTYNQRRIINGHTNYVRSVVFSFDGKLLASSGSDSYIKIWNVDTGECLKTIADDINRIWSLSFSPDNRFLACGGSDKQVKIWDLETQRCVEQFTSHQQAVKSVCFSPDGKTLASASEDKTIRIWQINTGECQKVLKKHDVKELWCVAYSPLGKILASGDQNGNIVLWNIQTGKAYKKLNTYSNNPIRTLAFSTDGEIIASSCDENLIRMWNVKTGECFQTLQGHTKKIWSVAFALNNQTLISGSEDQTIRFWDLKNGKCSKIIQGYKNLVVRLAFSKDGKTLASGHQDNNIYLWNYHTGKRLITLKGHIDTVQSLVFSSDAQFLASGSKDLTLKIWDLKTCSCIKTLQGHSDIIWAVAFSPDGSTIASASNDCSVKIWDTKTGDCLITINEHQSLIWSVAFDSSGQILASGDDDGVVKLWSTKTGKCIKTLKGQTGKSWVLNFDSNANTISSSSGKQILNSWNIETGKLIKNIPQPNEQSWTADLSSDGHFIANATDSNEISIWNSSTGDKIQNLEGHLKPIWTVVFSYKPDNIVASSSWDETIKVWDIGTGECLHTLKIPRPYEGMIINEVKGLTISQKETLKSLGAVEDFDILSSL